MLNRKQGKSMASNYRILEDFWNIDNFKSKGTVIGLPDVGFNDYTYTWLGKVENKHRSVIFIDESGNTKELMFPNTQNLKAEHKKFILGGSEQHYGVEITLLNNDLEYEYNFLIMSLIGVIDEERDKGRAIILLRDEIIKWQNLLQNTPSKKLSNREQIGLFGELVVLEDILIPHYGENTSLDLWAGGKGTHDFTTEQSAIEVKCRVNGTGNNLNISSEGQLDCVSLDFLALFVISVNLDETIGQSLNERVQSIMEKAISKKCSKIFIGKLNDYGYKIGDDYQEKKYSEISPQCYQVTNEFPKITQNNIDSGISKVKYELDPDSINQFQKPYSIVYENVSGYDAI